MAQPTTTTSTIEQYIPYVKYNGGIATDLPVYINSDIEVTGALSTGEQVVTAVSNGTTAVSVFGSSGLTYDIDITGVYLIARDTTATNITVEAPAATTVATIAKGTSAGALVGATSLSDNTSIPAGTNVVIDGSGAGVAQVFITYKKSA